MNEHDPQQDAGLQDEAATDDEGGSAEGEQRGAPANGLSGLPPDTSVQLGNPDPEQGGAH